MHGRLKVKTTEEQMKHKLLEKENKSKIFRELRDKVIEGRKSGDKSKEMLCLLADCLIRTPEWNLFWNYRREILQEWNFDESLMTRELTLTENCLRENSKAYSVWHHREWVMLHHPVPDWTKELSLCNHALTLDERNFHCWDYRRFVVKHGNISREAELAFTTTRVTNDISDYSSWHYRRSLLLDEPETADIDCELDLINNAVYTDPSDQSPWFYLRWLITRHYREPFLREMFVSKSLCAVVLIMSESVSLRTISQFTVKITAGEWSQPLLNYMPAIAEPLSVIWLLSLADIDFDRSLVIETRSLVDPAFHWQCELTAASQESLIRVDTDINKMLCDATISLDLLRRELAEIRSLGELEPNNKCVLLALVSLLRVLSPRESESEIIAILARLASLDSVRARLYNDLASKYRLECALIELYQSHTRHLSMSNHGLTRVTHCDWMALMTSIDLSHNSLGQQGPCSASLASQAGGDTVPTGPGAGECECDGLASTDMTPPVWIGSGDSGIATISTRCQYWLCVSTLNLAYNQIQSLAPLRSLPSLTHCDVSHNLIATFADLEPILHCPRLTHLNIKANQVSQLSDLTERVATHPCARANTQSISIVYDTSV